MTMNKVLVAVLLLAGGLLSAAPALADAQGTKAHMDAIMTASSETPSGEGLLPTAIAEARIAADHASLAAQKPGDLAWMKTHSEHVLHAVDPAVSPSGPGLGYGVLKASSGVADHMKSAMNSLKAAPSVKMYGPPVLAGAENAVARAEAIVDLGLKVRAAAAPALAYPMVEEIERLVTAMLEGADGDGEISEPAGKGGLLSALHNAELIMAAEDFD